MTTERVGFVPVADDQESIPRVSIGMLGYRRMARIHSTAYRRIPVVFWPPAAYPRLVAICGRTEKAVREAAVRYRYEGYYTDWRQLVQDDGIQAIDNCASANAHVEPSIAALRAGKHVLCEKPLALSVADARSLWQEAEQAGVKHMTGFNYRFLPAVRLVRTLVERGTLGRIYHFRACYLQEGGDDPSLPFGWRYDRAGGVGYGALGNIGVHIIDLARFLVGEIESVAGGTATFVKQRPLPTEPDTMREVTTDDAFAAVIRFAGGALGTLEASKFAVGRKNHNRLELNAAGGSVVFDLERLNELQVYLRDARVKDVVGFTNVSVTEASHPFYQVWWPPGHIIGWEHSFIHETEHFIRCVARDTAIAPYGATFEDGYRALQVANAILESSATGRWVGIED